MTATAEVFTEVLLPLIAYQNNISKFETQTDSRASQKPIAIQTLCRLAGMVTPTPLPGSSPFFAHRGYYIVWQEVYIHSKVCGLQNEVYLASKLPEFALALNFEAENADSGSSRREVP